MSVRNMLDGAAAEATVGLRVDLGQAYRQAEVRRARARRRASAVMASAVAVASLIALIVVLTPGGLFRAVAPAPASPGRPIGLPAHWYYTPRWTPPVTRHPMIAASMVLAAPLQPGWGTWSADAPVLVSADGSKYASLPWGREDGLVALAPSGRDVGWVSPAEGNAARSGAVVHRIRLSDGRRRDVELPPGDRVERLLWVGDRLYVTASKPSGAGTASFELAAGSDVLAPATTLPPAALPRVPVDGASNPAGSADTANSADPASSAGDSIVSPFAVYDPDGVRSATLLRRAGADQKTPGTAAFSLLLTGGGGREIPITASDPVTDAQLLGWAEGGIVVRVHTRDRKYSNESISLRLFAPDGGSFKILSRARETHAVPVAVAVDVVGRGTTVPAAGPQFPGRDRSHLRYLSVLAWSTFHLGLWLNVLFLLAVLTALSLVVRGLRRAASQGRTG